jgi:hypothetical protein
MAIDVREIRGNAAESQETVANAVTGAAFSVGDAVSDPVGTVRKTVRRLEKRGASANARLQRRVDRTAEKTLDAAADVASGNLAEWLTLAGIRAVKERARRRDMLGNVLFRGLELIHGGLGGYVEELGKFRTATEPPARSGQRRQASPARPSAARRTAGTRSSRAPAKRRSTASR